MNACLLLCDNEIIDANFYAKLQWAIGEVIKEQNEIDFLFVNYNKLCLDAVLEAKLEHPDKHIQVIAVGYTQACYLPCCALDRHLDTPEGVSNFYPWVMDQCDFVIYYHYDDLNMDNRPYRNVKQTKAELINLSQSNDRIIQKCVANYLDESERRLKALLDNGLTYAAIAREIGISNQGVRLRVNKLVRKLTAFVKFEKKRTEIESRDDPQSHPIICSLFDFEPQCDEQRSKRIRQAVRYVIDHNRSCTFLVEREMCHSEMVKAVCDTYPFRCRNGEWNVDICLAEHRAEGEKEVAAQALQAPYVSPFYGTLHIDTKAAEVVEQRRRVWSMMLGQSDFAICSGEGIEARLTALRAASGHPNSHLPLLKVLNVSKRGR